jgi:hypothetical protein
MAYGPDGDFNFLELGRAAFDLSDRGVSGRLQHWPEFISWTAALSGGVEWHTPRRCQSMERCTSRS